VQSQQSALCSAALRRYSCNLRYVIDNDVTVTRTRVAKSAYYRHWTTIAISCIS